MENEVKISAIDVQKELMKSKVMAKFSHYEKGKLFYTVELESGTFQFPMSTVDTGTLEEIHGDDVWTKDFNNNEFKKTYQGLYLGAIVKQAHDNQERDAEQLKISKLSEDLGSTKFFGEIRGSELFRWIKKAINSEDFMKIN